MGEGRGGGEEGKRLIVGRREGERRAEESDCGGGGERENRECIHKSSDKMCCLWRHSRAAVF